MGGLGVVLVQAFADQAVCLGAEGVVEQAAEVGFGGNDEALVLVAGASKFDVLGDFAGENLVLVLLRVGSRLAGAVTVAGTLHVAGAVSHQIRVLFPAVGVVEVGDLFQPLADSRVGVEFCFAGICDKYPSSSHIALFRWMNKIGYNEPL